MSLKLVKEKLKDKDKILAELRDVVKVFSNGEVVISDLNLVINKSDFITLLGKSGCGKTTILKILCGLLKPTKGKVIWPTSTFTNSERNPANLSVVFQDSNLLPWLSVFDNIYLPLKLNKIEKYDGYERVIDCLRVVGFNDYKNYYPNQLSGGMKMRVAIARSLVTKPKVILMDEPFAALDEITRFRLNNDLLKIYKKYDLTIIFITHSIYESVYLSNKIALISDKPASLLETIYLSSNKNRTDNYRLSTEYLENCRMISEKLIKYNNLIK